MDFNIQDDEKFDGIQFSHLYFILPNYLKDKFGESLAKEHLLPELVFLNNCREKLCFRHKFVLAYNSKELRREFNLAETKSGSKYY